MFAAMESPLPIETLLAWKGLAVGLWIALFLAGERLLPAADRPAACRASPAMPGCGC